MVDGAPSATVIGNTLDLLAGGRGGDGAENPGGIGGRGGDGGPAAGIVIANTPTVDASDNIIRAVTGGRGGSGGGSLTTANGGAGGNAGDAAGMYLVGAAFAARWYTNLIDGVSGGVGGNGNIGTATDGSGGTGGDATGLAFAQAMNADATGNTVQNLWGGLGGNSSATGTGRGAGADGGAASGMSAFSLTGSTIFSWNSVAAVRGGGGGRGQASGGNGGNATGLLAFGNNDGNYNFTTATFNQIQSITGGNGGFGQRFGGDGGSSSGLVVLLASLDSAANTFSSFVAGNGGDALDGTDGGRGGDAIGITAVLVPLGWSSWDWINTMARGASGAGPPAQAAYGMGYYLLGIAGVTTRMTIDNGTLQSIGTLDLWVNNYTEATTINTTFNGAKLAVEATGNLTVKNYLGVEVLWPDGATLVGGASIVVLDQGLPIWNVASATGREAWLLATDRVYVNSRVPTDNTTRVTVSYLGYSFNANPRMVDMATSHTETFTMVDSDAPTSAAGALPQYENVLGFSVSYTASDGNGAGLANITLRYRKDGAGWNPFATQPAGNAGAFAFTASGDGTYEFATVATDVRGNTEPMPVSNDTWTIVDTTRPGSHVDPLSTYKTTRAFLVTWAPDAGVTDIAAYEVQYNSGAGWVTWLPGTTQTSGTFTAQWDGLFQFRTKAMDYAGNTEVVPATNDTWTIVDTFAPFTFMLPLPVWQTSSSFLVQWGREADDVASYRIQVRDNGGAWTVWVPSTTNTSATFTGAQDGHTYEFRSIGTDFAGNVQPAPAVNQSWTIVDLSPPDSAVTALPPYEITLLFGVSWAPVSGTTDIILYTLEVSDNGGPWTQVPGSVATTATSASFVGVDGHRYAFRSLARDRAGNVEPAPAGNDTWTIVDVTRPGVITSSPRGAGTNTTPVITVTFSEPMNRASAELAFSITPDMNGAHSWSVDSRVMTFIPERPLDSGKDYFVAIDSSARDVAGNTANAPYTFQFTTRSTATGPGVDAFLWVIPILTAVVVAGLLLFLLMRRRRAPASAEAVLPATATPPQSQAVIDDVFLLYNDGILIKHETRRLKPDVDTDILSGMLTAVQQFVKDSFRSEEGELDEMTFGQMHILIGRGKWVILAAIVSGDGTESFTQQIKECIKDVEAHQWDQLESWNGDMVIAKTLTPYVKKLIRGDYAKAS